MARLSIIRGAAAGSALFVSVAGVRTRGFRRLSARWAEGVEDVSALYGVNVELGAGVGTLGVAATGAGFGAACALATRVIPLPPIAAGVVVGVLAWTAVEMCDRQAADRKGWVHHPQLVAAALWAAEGAAIGSFLSRRNRR
jgi:xanthine/uracil permease